MNQLITASIDVMKIDKTRLITGKKGTYLNVTIWVNSEPDQFGNNVSIEQRTEKGQKKIYLGNGKTYHKKEETEGKPENNEGKPQKGTDVESQIRNGDFLDKGDNLPF